jgi:methylenetetrahydrofolate dehydrogenase (NADP+)/methenyltetrahydrofolate cyclohydrolase
MEKRECVLIDGKALSLKLRMGMAGRVAALADRGIIPGLAVVLVGDDPASAVYVAQKEKACREVGLHSETFRLPASTETPELLDLVGRLNGRADIHGILVQLPLPGHLPAGRIVDAISPAKDVDGLHPVSLGCLVADRPGFLPCTPHGVMKMLAEYDVPVAGRHAVVVGRSPMVGKPMAFLLLREHATVTICHSRTPDLGVITRQADILVAAVGRAGLVTAGMVKPGAVVIDVGVNRMPDGKLKGDVDFGPVSEVASAITPVPGGVGPMTITMLLENTLLAAEGPR